MDVIYLHRENGIISIIPESLMWQLYQGWYAIDPASHDNLKCETVAEMRTELLDPHGSACGTFGDVWAMEV